MTCIDLIDASTVNVFRDPRWGRGQETPGMISIHYYQYLFIHLVFHTKLQNIGEGTNPCNSVVSVDPSFTNQIHSKTT